jgi:hypothetical protein
VGMFNVTINTDTPAFLDPERRVWATDADARGAGVRLVLAALSKRLDRDGALTPGMGGPLVDTDGETVGHWSYTGAGADE